MFDHGWADAFERAGGAYYPQAAGRRPLHAGDRAAPAGRAPAATRGSGGRLLASAIVRMARQAGVSGAHVNFATEPEWRLMGELGFLQRTGVQFHWRNRGYEDFDAFLETLSSRRRKTIRRERRDAVAAGIDIEVLSGDRLTPSVWDAFFAFYRDTGERKWGVPYLTRRFFDLLGERMADKVALVMCRRGERWGRGRPQPDRRDRPLRPLLGLRRGPTASCISSAATTRPSTTRFAAAWPASRPAPRVLTRSGAVMCPCPPIRRTGSSMAGCATRSPGSWSRKPTHRGRDRRDPAAPLALPAWRRRGPRRLADVTGGGDAPRPVGLPPPMKVHRHMRERKT